MNWAHAVGWALLHAAETVGSKTGKVWDLHFSLESQTVSKEVSKWKWYFQMQMSSMKK